MNLEVFSAERQAVDHWFDGIGLAADCLDRSRFFVLCVDGVVIGAYALEVRGVEGWLIAGAGGHPDLDLTRDFLPFVETQLAGCDRVYIQTRRAGLVRKLADCGYTLASTVLVKAL